MTINTEDLLNSILESVGRIDYIHPVDIPNIDLYMDQVTTFMEEQLSSTKRYEDDKILTKTMINNYAKNNLLPPPNKKKYSKEHLLVLIFVYYFKNLLSIKDIEILLKPLTYKRMLSSLIRLTNTILQLSDPAFFHLTDFFIDTFHVKFRIHSKIFVCQWL